MSTEAWVDLGKWVVGGLVAALVALFVWVRNIEKQSDKDHGWIEAKKEQEDIDDNRHAENQRSLKDIADRIASLNTNAALVQARQERESKEVATLRERMHKVESTQALLTNEVVQSLNEIKRRLDKER